ncbi:CocE/NonD family hydrolase [Streptomyces sp. NPDC059063]|uniref:CocE/NonD family hydrolase n=1 Tax=unclassified Streptomyces TaxID=2593676 RepID=UPI0036B12C2D
MVLAALSVEVPVSRRTAPPPRRVAPRSRASLALACATALAASLLVAAPAAGGTARGEGGAGTERFTVTPLTFTVEAGGRTCAVDADLYRPAGVDRAHPAPAVLTTNGFGGSKTEASTAAIGKGFAERGYVGLVYSGLGFGRSGCLISLDDPGIDGRAASALIDFLAGERAADDGTVVDFVTKDDVTKDDVTRNGVTKGGVARSGGADPRVGMIGGSYGGAIQLATASRDHRVDALVPLITWNDLAYSLAPNNAVDRTARGREVPGAAKWQWMNGFYLTGEGQPVLVPNLDPSRVNSLDCLHFVTRACETIRTLNSGGYPAEKTRRLLAFTRSVSPVSYLPKVKAPTLLVQGQADTLFNLNEAEATYRALKRHGTTAKMIWQSWGHSGGTNAPAAGELDLLKGNWESSYVGRRVLAWFDRYLRHDKRAGTGPGFAYYRDWIGDPDRTYATARDVPPLSRTLYLSGGGKLVDDRADVTRGRRTYRNWTVPTSHSESAVAAQTGQPDPAPYDLKGTHLAWTTAPLDRAVDVVGAPEATLEVASPLTERTQRSADAADKLVLFAKLYDVAPDGTKVLVHRLVAPVRVPDVTRPFRVTLPGIVHRYGKGHRIRFVIAASDGAYGGNRGVKPVTVTHAPGDTGTLRLPVAP